MAQAAATPGAGSYSARILAQSGAEFAGGAEAVTVPGASPLI